MNIEENFKLNKKKKNTFMNRISNGRVDISGNIISRHQFPLFSESSKGNHFYKNEALKSILQASKIYNIFFSENNINLLQKLLIYQVWIQSDKKYMIKKQSYNELKIIMRSIFLQYSKNQNINLKYQLKSLNEKVLNYSIKNVLTNIEQFVGFKKDINSLPQPIQRPTYTSSQGTKSYQ